MLTTDPTTPCLHKTRPDGQNECYLVLSEEECAKGFVRPVRTRYTHVGRPGPEYPLRDLTDEEKEQYREYGYVAYEAYPPDRSPLVGRHWTQEQLDSVGKGCGTVTPMGLALSETYARQPNFYGRTFCCGCGTHLPVGFDGEFIWTDDGTRVGS